MKNLLLILIIGLLTNCSPSLVYSPSVGLTNTPLKDKEIDLRGGVELFPETRAEVLNTKNTSFGASGQLSYGFSDKFNMTLKGWIDIEGGKNPIRSGYSLTSQFLKPIDDNSRLMILPRVGIALSGNDISGYGLGSSIIYQKSIYQNLSWYGGAGLFWGFRSLEKEFTVTREERFPMGLGIVGNLGLGWQLSKNIRLNAELNPIYQLNNFDENTQFLVSPTIGIGYTINRRVD